MFDSKNIVGITMHADCRSKMTNRKNQIIKIVLRIKSSKSFHSDKNENSYGCLEQISTSEVTKTATVFLVVFLISPTLM